MTDLEKGMEAFNNKDYKTALGILHPLAEQGEAQAELILGSMLEAGLGIPQSYREAFVWYERAYNKGYAMAQFRIGDIYYQGLMGFEQDFVMARDCFRSAAKQGLPAAQYNLAGMYERGESVEASPAEAHKWYNIAAANGNEDAVIARDRVAENMTPAQIEKAQDLALFMFNKSPQLAT